jgi:hypothetical protein
LLRERFIAVSIDVMAAAKRRDAAADFLRESGCVRFRSSGYVSVVTADGKTLGIVNPNGYRTGVGTRAVGLQDWLRARLVEWEALPEERRRPGAVEVPRLEPEDVDPNFLALRPPKNALVLRVTNRTMQWNESGAPRHLCADDFDSEEVCSSESLVARYRDPANDFMWVLEEEWRALFRDDARSGLTFAVPEPLKLRLFGHQLNPNLGIQGSRAYSPRSIESCELNVTVEEATDESIRVCLEGNALLDSAGGLGTRLIYRPAVLGHATYDRKRGAVTEFELVAFGELSGRLHRGPASLFSEKPRLLGVAFDLIPEPKGAQRLRPNAARMTGSEPLIGLHYYLNPRGQ